MPMRPLRPCNFPRCPALIREGSYCPSHKPKRFDSRPSAALRGYDAAWRKRRAEILERDGHRCQPCARVGNSVVATSVDHIVPKFKGGSGDDSNLESVCDYHQRSKAAREGAEARRIGN